MDNNIVGLDRDPHDETQLLLPWYVTGRLEPADLARVETHLAGCARCQAELRSERRLEAAIAVLPTDVDQAWAAMARRVEPVSARRGGEPRTWALGRGAPWLGWAAAAALAVALVAALPAGRPDLPLRYHTLGAAGTRVRGNVIVMFRPEASAANLGKALEDSKARMVGGPTAAGAFVLNVPAAQRAGAIAILRARREVALAEPIDPGGPP